MPAGDSASAARDDVATIDQRVCVIVPCYNEEQRLRGEDLVAFVDHHPLVTLCLVDDGSGDGTLRVLNGLAAQRPGRILVVAVTPNRGKAEAVRAGVLSALEQGDWPVLGYWDADLSTPLEEIENLQAALAAAPKLQLVMGSRVKRLGSYIDRRARRHVLGRIFATCATVILGLPVYDSQCGAKLFRRQSVAVFFDTPFLTRWLFDLEMLARLRNAAGTEAMRTVLEVPLGEWREVGGSKLKLPEMIAVPLELLKIRRHYNR